MEWLPKEYIQMFKQDYETENPQLMICLPKGPKHKSTGLFDDAKRTKKHLQVSILSSKECTIQTPSFRVHCKKNRLSMWKM